MALEPSELTVPAELEQASIVRQFVRLACHRYGCDAAADNVLAVTDELVANAFEHRSGPDDTVRVGITPTPNGVRVEVHDHSHAALPLPRTEEQPSARRIVESLAADWGVADEPDGTTTWAELSAAGSPPVDHRHA